MLQRVDRVLGAEECDVGADFRIGGMSLEELPHPRPRAGEQRLMDECDRRRRALNVQQDGASVGQRDAVRSGMYVGPMQTGW
jgi:hypothetical protein